MTDYKKMFLDKVEENKARHSGIGIATDELGHKWNMQSLQNKHFQYETMLQIISDMVYHASEEGHDVSAKELFKLLCLVGF